VTSEAEEMIQWVLIMLEAMAEGLGTNFALLVEMYKQNLIVSQPPSITPRPSQHPSDTVGVISRLLLEYLRMRLGIQMGKYVHWHLAF
jgi:hypothetical protein